ncbi:hypothetical protein Tco_0409158 [Tanacetum coccineum]
MVDETKDVESVPIHSNDPLLSEISKLKEKVKKLERKSLGAQEDASKEVMVDLDTDVRKLKLKSSSTAKPYYKHTVDELTLAQTLTEIKAAKPKAVTTAATTTTTTVTRPKARGVVVQEPNSFVPMDTEVAEGSKKRIREELESDNLKKQKIDENVEAKVDGEAEMKKLMKIVPDDEVAIDAILLATKSPIIVD